MKKNMKNSQQFVDKIMERIHRENIQMKPAIYFIFRSLLLKISVVVLAAVAAFLTNVALFKLRIYDPLGFLSLGTYGYRAFLGAVPWLILLSALLAAGGAFLAVTRFDFAHKTALPRLFLTLFLVIVVGGIMIDRTGINEKAYKFQAVPYLYKGNFIGKYWVMGEIEKIDREKMQMEVVAPSQRKITVVWTNSTLFFKRELLEGSYVKIVGERKENYFIAQDVAISSFHW